MHEETLPSHLRRLAIGTPPEITNVGSNRTTSVYETHLGLAAFTWSRAVLGLSLTVEIRLPSSSSSSSLCSGSRSASTSPVSSTVSSSDSNSDSFSFRLRPWISWKRWGTKRFELKDQRRKVDFGWDLSRASFPASGGPEPIKGFYVAVAVDSEMFLIVGDLPAADAYGKMRIRTKIPNFPMNVRPSFSRRKGSPANPILVSRSEEVGLPDSSGNGGDHRPYTTRASMGGKEREISIDMSTGREKEPKLSVGIDGKQVLEVKRLRWNFRGNEKVEVEDGGCQISWDAHKWFFSSNLEQVKLVFRFERSSKERDEECGEKGGGWVGMGTGMYAWGYFGNTTIRSDVDGRRKGRRRKKSLLLKTDSSSSSQTSTASTASSSSVLGWTSTEEKELKDSDGFFLVVYIWIR